MASAGWVRGKVGPAMRGALVQGIGRQGEGAFGEPARKLRGMSDEGGPRQQPSRTSAAGRLQHCRCRRRVQEASTALRPGASLVPPAKDREVRPVSRVSCWSAHGGEAGRERARSEEMEPREPSALLSTPPRGAERCRVERVLRRARGSRSCTGAGAGGWGEV